MKVNDGSISCIIILSSILVVPFVVLFGIASFEHPSVESFGGSFVGPKTVYLSICFLIAAVTCIVFIVANRLTDNIADLHTKDRFFHKIKLSFLWIFTGFTVFYSTVKIIKTLTCYPQETDGQQTENAECKTVPSSDNDAVLISYKVVQILFYIVQSTFVHRFINYQFCASWKIYYSLLLIFLANISQWTHFFADIYMTADENIAPCSADNNTSIDYTCYAAEVFASVRPYCHPIELEYSLLSMIFLAELWPAQTQYTHLSCDLQRGHVNRSITTDFTSIVDSISQPSEQSLAIEKSTNNFNGRENLIFLGLENSLSSYSIICVVSGILFCAPKFVIGFLLKSEAKSPSNYSNFEIHIYTKSSMIELSYFSYDIVISLVLIFLLIFCFHALSLGLYFTAIRSVEIFYLHQNILIISFLGSIAYVSLELLSCILLLKIFDKNETKTLDNDAYLLMVKWVIKLFQLYFQIICILQFDNYKKVPNCNRNKFWKITQGVILMLATLNFCFWVADSIFEATFYDNNVLQVVYNRGVEKLITHFLFPFLVFFRFESFICFYGFYRQN